MHQRKLRQQKNIGGKGGNAMIWPKAQAHAETHVKDHQPHTDHKQPMAEHAVSEGHNMAGLKGGKAHGASLEDDHDSVSLFPVTKM